MESRVESAAERHRRGYNCAQAIACTYCDLVGMDEETMFKLSEGLGLGMGCMEGTCGAVSGACLLAGMKRSSGNLQKPDSKGETYKLSKQIINAFKDRSTSITCKEIKGAETGRVLRACPDCVKDAAEIVEEILFSS